MDKWFELGMKKRNKEIKDKWNDLAKGSPFKTGEHFRKWVDGRIRRGRGLVQTTSEKESVDIHQDGSQSSHRLLRMTFNESKDPEFLLQAHGYSLDAWELVSARSNIWNAYSKQDGVQTLYSSRITVKPLTNSWNLSELIETIKGTQPVEIDYRDVEVAEIDYIEIALFDMHFGITDFEYYKPTHFKIMKKLKKKYKEVLFVIGQDLFHNDDFRGRTTRGTQIQKVDMIKAWSDAMIFYEKLIQQALESKSEVKIMYSRGNHDETVSYFFVQTLKAKFPQANVDDRFKERKVHMLGTNFIGFNHGDKKKEDHLTENFATEFPIEWSRATTRQIHTGHRHSERVVDKGGVLLRRLPTRNKVDDWHDDEGYTTSHKRFEIFFYSENELEGIDYV